MTFDELYDIIISTSLKARGSSIQRRRTRVTDRPAAKWTSPSRIEGSDGTALAVVLSTIGCSHARSDSGGCTMCSYLLDGSGGHVDANDLVKQFSVAYTELDSLDSPLAVKLYTSGSFLDPNEVPVEARDEILEIIAKDERVRSVIIESRPEFVIDSVMGHIRTLLGNRTIEIGVGLESSNDTVRIMCINKGFNRIDFESAIETAQRYNIGVRAYVLVKPPFLTEKEALHDAITTIKYAADVGVTTVSVNPVNIQKATLVEHLWKRGDYRPPWLWTLLEVLRVGRETIDEKIDIVCDPVAAGKPRGTHNCRECDSSIVKTIRSFSLTQDVRELEGHDCTCKRTWKHVIEHEDTSFLVHRYFT